MVWFHPNVPKFALITWLAVHNRLQTLDRVKKWQQINEQCLLCGIAQETRLPIFYEFCFAKQVWGELPIAELKWTLESYWWLELGVRLGFATVKR